jgi:hypothetical protein
VRRASELWNGREVGEGIGRVEVREFGVRRCEKLMGEMEQSYASSDEGARVGRRATRLLTLTRADLLI